MHFHYCMGELQDWGFTKSETKTCGNCGMDKSEKDGCCKDEQKQVKIEKAQKAGNSFQFANVAVAVASVGFLPFTVPSTPAVAEAHPPVHAPPKTGKSPVFVLNCNFRI